MVAYHQGVRLQGGPRLTTEFGAGPSRRKAMSARLSRTGVKRKSSPYLKTTFMTHMRHERSEFRIETDKAVARLSWA